MSAIKNIFAFKTVFSDQKTYLVYSISKREKINYSQVQMFQNEEYKDYFVPFQCTKTATTNKISFDISGLTSLSEYLKSSMQQSDYFEVIMGIQKIASFCQEHHLSYDNLVCSPKYMFYHNVLKKVLMAYVPLNNPHYICDSIPQCLVKLHKCAENVIITDGNYMNAYEAYLNSFQNADKKANQTFSPNSLLHFFNLHEDTDLKSITINSKNQRDERPRHSIADQIGSTPTPIPTPVLQPEPAPLPVSAPQSGGTFVRRKNRAYLSDENGRRIDIISSLFKIGRNAENDLVIPQVTVSGSHAEISQQDGCYYVKDISTNGTYLNDANERAAYSRLTDGDRIYFDEFCYVFHQEKEQETNSATLMVSRRNRSEKPLAYIIRMANNTRIRVLAYPFSDTELPGIVMISENQGGRPVLYVENHACPSLRLENVMIETGTKKEIFSGCSLYIHDEKYMFLVEN